jgi:hypothetical protein
MLQFAELRFADHIFFATFEFSIYDPNIFCGLKTYTYPQVHNFSPYKYKLKCSHSNLRTTSGFWDSFELHDT